MWISDILTAIELLSDIAVDNGDTPPLIEKIENNFVILTNGEKITFRDIPCFLESTGRA